MGYRSNQYAVCTENSHKRNCCSEKKKTDVETKVKKKVVKHVFVKTTEGLVIHGDRWTPHLLVSCLLTGQFLYGDTRVSSGMIGCKKF